MRVRVTRVREEMRACAGAQAVRQAIRDAKKADAASPRGGRMPKKANSGGGAQRSSMWPIGRALFLGRDMR